MSKVLIIGIDGMDRDLLKKFGAYLPTITKIGTLSPKVDLRSTFPPDSETAWASIYSGLNPARHGVVHFLDPLEKSLIYQTKDSENIHIKEKTFWDIAGRYGKKVCIILPHIGYPVWDVNGVMITRSSIKDDIQTYPVNVTREFGLRCDLNVLNTVKGFPGRGGISHDEFIDRHKKIFYATMDLGLEMLGKDEWDIFFIYSSALDVIPHFFWKYFDDGDLTYPGKNPYKDVIKEFYKLHDDMIKKFYMQLGSDDTLIILSDHGHGRRPVKSVNINDILKQKGLLFPKSERTSPTIIETIKWETLRMAGKYNLENLGSKIFRFVPRLRNIYTTPSSIEWKKTIAYTSDLSGIKSYSYGGIKMNKELIKDDETYEKIRDEIIKILYQISDQLTNKKLVKWAMRREDLYQGHHIGEYPDIVFNLLDDYGIGSRINTTLIESSNSHGIVPGSHIGDNAVFYIVGNKVNIEDNRKTSPEDIAPTVLDILGIDWKKFNFDGKSILKVD